MKAFELEKHITPWLTAKRLTFVALSAHVKISLSDSLSRWDIVKNGLVPRIEVLVPIFSAPQEPVISGQSNISFAIQGYVNTSRRNYQKIFAALSRAMKQLADTAGQPNQDVLPEIWLHLVGHKDKDVKVPAELTRNVVFHEDLPYLAFYNLLSRMTALVPAFTTDAYFDIRASSSVPASLIAGIPIIASRRMLQSYTYLEENAVWPQLGQDDTEVMEDIVSQTVETRVARVNAARESARRILIANQEAVKSWAAEVLVQAPVLKAQLQRDNLWQEWSEGMRWWSAGFPHSKHW